MSTNLKNFISDVNSFNNWEFKKEHTSKTQERGTFVENYVEAKFDRNFNGKAIIQKIGSQGHPDFFIFNKEDHDNFLKVNKDKIEKKILQEKKKGKTVTGITRDMILKWEKSTSNNKKSKLVRVEIKTTTNDTYKLNDTFINPFDNEIYIFANFKREKLIINTTFDMIEKEGDKEKYLKLTKEFHELKTDFKNKWDFKNIKSYPRPNLSINQKYVEIDLNLENINTIFTDANIEIK